MLWDHFYAPGILDNRAKKFLSSVREMVFSVHKTIKKIVHLRTFLFCSTFEIVVEGAPGTKKFYNDV